MHQVIRYFTWLAATCSWISSLAAADVLHINNKLGNNTNWAASLSALRTLRLTLQCPSITYMLQEQIDRTNKSGNIFIFTESNNNWNILRIYRSLENEVKTIWMIFHIVLEEIQLKLEKSLELGLFGSYICITQNFHVNINAIIQVTFSKFRQKSHHN